MSATPTLHVADPILLDFAADVGPDGPIAIEGNRTRWNQGGALDAGTRLLTAPTGIVNHRPEEMTVQVRAGTPVAELDAALATTGQRCALPLRGGTVGGAVVVGENHVDVLGRGAVRESVLQVRYVSAEGRIVTGGGPVVKNVSGFNLPKLITGSLGTLGLLVEVVLRTNPIPPASRWVTSDDIDPFAVPSLLLRPSSVLWNGTTTWVHVEGHPADVEAELAVLGSNATLVDADGPPTLPTHRWTMTPADLRGCNPSTLGAFVASIGVGQLWAEQPSAPIPVDPVVQMLTNRLKNNFDPTGRLNPGRRP